MKKYVHNFSSKQVHLRDFDSTDNDVSDIETLNTDTQEQTNFTLTPGYSCRCKRGYNLTSDIFNPWKLQEEPEDCSREDLARACRLRIVSKGGF